MQARDILRYDNGMGVLRRYPILTFALGAVAIVAASRLVIATPNFKTNPELLSAAVLADLVVTLPVLYLLLVVRGSRVSAWTVLPVLLLGLGLARWLLLPQHLHCLPGLEVLAVAAEAALLLSAGTRAVRVRQAYRRAGLRDATFVGAFAHALCEVLGNSLFTAVLISEVTTWYYALFSYRATPDVEAGATAFSGHRRVAWGAVLVALSLAVLLESYATHVVVSLWSTKWAWVLTGLSGYGLLWLLGDYRALLLRPTLLTPSALRLRVGTRWHVDVPLADIESIRPYAPADARREGFRRVTVLGPPLWTLLLRGPAVLEGPFGIHRTASSLGVALDRPDFAQQVRASLPAASASS